MPFTFLQHIILIENMGKGTFKENEEKNCDTTIKNARPEKHQRLSGLETLSNYR